MTETEVLFVLFKGFTKWSQDVRSHTEEGDKWLLKGPEMARDDLALGLY